MRLFNLMSLLKPADKVEQSYDRNYVRSELSVPIDRGVSCPTLTEPEGDVNQQQSAPTCTVWR